MAEQTARAHIFRDAPSLLRQKPRANHLVLSGRHSIDSFQSPLNGARDGNVPIQNSSIGNALTPASERPSTETDWIYGMCPLDTSPDKFGPFESLVDVWRRRRGTGRLLPARRNFPVEDFAPWMGRIFIAKIEHQPFNLRFTLWGTSLVEWWGVDYTNKTLGEASSAPESWREERAYFQEMVRAPFIGIASGYLTHHDRGYIRIVGIDLPLADDADVTQILSAHLKVDTHVEPENVLPNCPLVPFVSTGRV